MKSLENMEEIRRYTFDELKEEMKQEDLMFRATAGITISGRWIDLLRLVKRIGGMEEFSIVYKTISTAHLRIVKLEEWEEYQKWRLEKNDTK